MMAARIQKRIRIRPDGLTLAICVHNGAARLPKVIQRIATQQDCAATEWEILLIDNASTDGSARAAKDAMPSSLSDRLRIVREEKLGVANARVRAIVEARYAWMSFVDDDNWISERWIAVISDVFRKHPTVALIHTPSRAHIQGPTPEGFDVFKGWLAIGSRVGQEGIIRERPVSFWTAGLSLRLSAFEFVYNPRFELTLSGRQGKVTLAGEDHELCLCALVGGWDAYFTKNAWIEHDLPKSRFTMAYLGMLYENGGKSRRLLNVYRRFFVQDNHTDGLPLLVEYALDLVRTSSAYYAKRVVGLKGGKLLPNYLSFRLSLGKLKGYFVSPRQVEQARYNIDIAQNYGRAHARGNTAK
jgi:glycosyltransferase involved in cell wall biosynthesis